MVSILLLLCLALVVLMGVRIQIKLQKAESECKRLEEMCAQLKAENIELKELVPQPSKVGTAITTVTADVGLKARTLFYSFKYGIRAFFENMKPKATT